MSIKIKVSKYDVSKWNDGEIDLYIVNSKDEVSRESFKCEDQLKIFIENYRKTKEEIERDDQVI